MDVVALAPIRLPVWVIVPPFVRVVAADRLMFGWTVRLVPDRIFLEVVMFMFAELVPVMVAAPVDPEIDALAPESVSVLELMPSVPSIVISSPATLRVLLILKLVPAPTLRSPPTLKATAEEEAPVPEKLRFRPTTHVPPAMTVSLPVPMVDRS